MFKTFEIKNVKIYVKANKQEFSLRRDKRTFCYSYKFIGPYAGVVIGVLKWLIFTYKFTRKISFSEQQ